MPTRSHLGMLTPRLSTEMKHAEQSVPGTGQSNLVRTQLAAPCQALHGFISAWSRVGLQIGIY